MKGGEGMLNIIIYMEEAVRIFGNQWPEGSYTQ